MLPNNIKGMVVSGGIPISGQVVSLRDLRNFTESIAGEVQTIEWRGGLFSPVLQGILGGYGEF